MWFSFFVTRAEDEHAQNKKGRVARAQREMRSLGQPCPARGSASQETMHSLPSKKQPKLYTVL